MNKANEIEIPVKFHNYKLLKDKEWVLKGSYLYFVQGPNEVGKTSFLTALQGVLTAKDITEKKVTTDEESGYYEFTIPAADGTMVTIRNTFTNDTSKFIAILESGEKVSTIKEIRELFNYTPINVHDFFDMSRSADGRRRQRDIILKLLPDKEREQFVDADLQEEHYYTERTEVGRSLDQAKGYMQSCLVGEEDQLLLVKEEKARELLEQYESELYNARNEEKVGLYISKLKEERERLEERIKEIDSELENIEVPKKSEHSNEELEKRISKGKEILRRIDEVKARNTLYEESRDKYKLLSEQYHGLSEKIDEKRSIKADIVQKAKLPVKNISFEEGYLIIDGFKFDETQVCESDAVLLLANILAKINPGPIQVIGDASILDFRKLEELNKIAETNNKVLFVDEVVRDANNLVIVGYEQLKSDNKKSKQTDPKPKKTDKGNGGKDRPVGKATGKSKTSAGSDGSADRKTGESDNGKEKGNVEEPLF